ncbi:hypothetical protein M8C21_000688 [Ambrosia artemisiifolia]|uniref:Uncharacterized protein n=1 Tax=Ambrosia artemisiifolia TaxID=4212 RepID=A0AAD5C5E3_AMBAR|nr:hypothetical protein M8C21_000688 [Ambrosia artemisiifolia]
MRASFIHKEEIREAHALAAAAAQDLAIEIISIPSDESDAADDTHVNSPVVEQQQPAVEQDDATVDPTEINNPADVSMNSTGVEDPSIVKQLTHRLRFPIRFAIKADFVNGAEILLQFENGIVIKKP